MPPDANAPRRPRGLRATAIVALLVAGAAVTTGLITRAHDRTALARWTGEHSLPHVSVVTPVRGQGEITIDLPGRLSADARVDGYLKRWHVDIGASVKEGELLGEIETPDLDQQLMQARADLALAQANAALSTTTAERYDTMLKTNSVSRQLVDEKRGDLASRRAMVKAAQAAVDRLLATKEFARIVAPFAGTVTARNAETGALINAGSSDAPPLFEISDTRRLRLYVPVPQVYVNVIGVGSEAEITVPERPGRSWRASVASMSRAVDAQTGNSLVQLLIDNAGGELLPGGFATVRVKAPSAPNLLSVPASALIVDQQGQRVAVVAPDGTVQLKHVEIARDLGRTLELSAGVAVEDRVIENPPDGLVDGAKVAVADKAS